MDVASVVADGPPPLATFTYDLAGNRLSKNLEPSRREASETDFAMRNPKGEKSGRFFFKTASSRSILTTL
jgi:hypothetical protein